MKLASAFVALALGAAPLAARAGEALGPVERVEVVAKGPLYHPEGPGRFRLRGGLGLVLDVLPRRVTESETRTIPELTGALRLGLPAGFSADLRARGAYVSNQVELGLAWSVPLGPFAVGPLVHGGVWFGALGFEGFDAFGYGGLLEPGLAVGYAAGDARLALTGEAIVTFAQHTLLGDAQTVSKQRVTFSGLATTLTVEVPLGPRFALHGGFGLLWTLPDYQAWIAFSDSTIRYAYPRFLAGVGF